MSASAHQTAICNASALATQLDEQATTSSGTLRSIISGVEVSKSAILIRLAKAPMAKQLGMEVAGTPQPSHAEETIDVSVTGQFLRCGKQVRLVLGNDADGQSEPDQKLIQEVLRAWRWFHDLPTGRVASIAELARRDTCSAPLCQPADQPGSSGACDHGIHHRGNPVPIADTREAQEGLSSPNLVGRTARHSARL